MKTNKLILTAAIVDYVDENIDQRDFIKNEDVVVAITHNNMIKAVKALHLHLL